MYEQFYRLREKPFGLSPDASYLYLARCHRHALTLLEYTFAEGASFALLTGEVGSGKTTVVQHYLERVQRRVCVGFISNTHPGTGPILPWIVGALGLEIGERLPAELFRRFVAHAKVQYQAGRRVVLVVDEAQNLPTPVLEELRVLSNLNVGKQLLLQTVLVGQPELRVTLRLPNLRQLAQRIAMDHHLEALQADETQAYIRHRLQVAGGRPELFAAEAVSLVHESTGGIPRLINIVCDTALVYGFSDQRREIDAALIEQVIRDRAAGVLPIKVPGRRVPGSVATG
jgi:type II secretory pathway predicted ATPase ExeA